MSKDKSLPTDLEYLALKLQTIGLGLDVCLHVSGEITKQLTMVTMLHEDECLQEAIGKFNESMTTLEEYVREHEIEDGV